MAGVRTLNGDSLLEEAVLDRNSDRDPEFILAGQVKSYDPARGFGFVVPETGGPDIMVHASAVRASGHAELHPGNRVRLEYRSGPRGFYALRVLGVEAPDGQGGFVAPEPPPRPTDCLPETPPDTPLQPARVKWFDRQRGFGFVNLFGDTQDVFVHMETVRAAGFADLMTGESVACRVQQGPRGLMVAELCHWDRAAGDAPAAAARPCEGSASATPCADRSAG